MLAINLSGLDSLDAAFDRLSRLEELDRAMRRSAEALRDLAARNLAVLHGSGGEPPSVTAGGGPLAWRIVSTSETGWRAEWGGLNSAARPWFGPAADASRGSIASNAANALASAAKSLR